MLRVEFWQERYESGDTPWDLGGPSPHFEALLATRPDWLQPGRMAVFGAGRGHDASLFAGQGFQATGFDYASGAVAAAQAQYGDVSNFVQADIFDLAAPQSPWAGQFDFVLEHTCFCAIMPEDRARYIQAAKNLLKPGGFLIGLFWEIEEPAGPPFTTTAAELMALFSDGFEILSIEPRPAVHHRGGTERLTVLRRQSVLK